MNTALDCHALLRGSSQPGDWTQGSHIAGRFFPIWATREDLDNIYQFDLLLHFLLELMLEYISSNTFKPIVWPEIVIGLENHDLNTAKSKHLTLTSIRETMDDTVSHSIFPFKLYNTLYKVIYLA